MESSCGHRKSIIDATIRGHAVRYIVRQFASKDQGIKILKNEEIKCPNMRVVYKDPTTSESKWEILDRKAALNLAKRYQLDLVLG
jgi:hypothetical protein